MHVAKKMIIAFQTKIHVLLNMYPEQKAWDDMTV
jgi:hypothetical protein